MKRLLTKAKTPVVRVVAAILRDRQRRLLIAQRLPDKMFGGTWEFPGGKIEEHETLEQALWRELDEELGLTPQHIAIQSLFYRDLNEDTDGVVFEVYYFLCNALVHPVPAAARQSQGVRFVPLEWLDTYQLTPPNSKLTQTELFRRQFDTKGLYEVRLLVEDEFVNDRDTAYTKQELNDDIVQALGTLNLIVRATAVETLTGQ